MHGWDFVSKKVQEREALKETQWWVGGKHCPGCGDGFVKKSQVATCIECTWFVHKRKGCLTKTNEGNYICGNCSPIQQKKGTEEQEN